VRKLKLPKVIWVTHDPEAGNIEAHYSEEEATDRFDGNFTVHKYVRAESVRSTRPIRAGVAKRRQTR
jgi:hypothetical protein